MKSYFNILFESPSVSLPHLPDAKNVPGSRSHFQVAGASKLAGGDVRDAQGYQLSEAAGPTCPALKQDELTSRSRATRDFTREDWHLLRRAGTAEIHSEPSI